MGFLFLTILLTFIQPSFAAHQPVYRGKIAVFQGSEPIAIEVELPRFSDGYLRTDQFHFANLPSTIKPDENGCICYTLDDDRFVFVHTFYYAVRMIEDYNKIFKRLALALPQTLEWTLAQDPDSPTSGFTELIKGTLRYPKPALDPSTLAHEIGHWIHYSAAGRDHFGSANPFELARALTKGVEEGSANFLAALYTGITRIGKYDSYEFDTDIDRFVRFPDHVPSTKKGLEDLAQNKFSQFAFHYPKFFASLQSMLDTLPANPIAAEYLNLPDPYRASSAFTQPVWAASVIYGTDILKMIYVKALSQLNQDQNYTYQDLTRALRDVAAEFNPEVGNYLSQEFALRGI